MAGPHDELDALIDAGRYLEAVDLLMADSTLARETRDPLLTELRHRAFETMDKTPGFADWPQRYSDPFPGETGVPVVEAADVDVETVGGALTHHGCLQVKGLMPSEQVDWFVEAIDQTFAAREDAAEWVDAQIEAETNGTQNPLSPPESSWFEPFKIGLKKAAGRGGDRYVRVADSPIAMRQLVSYFVDCGLRDIVQGYLGERPAMIANKWILRRSPSGVNGFDYHQDGRFLGEGIRTIDCWIALSTCGPGTGRPGMDCFPSRVELFESDEQSLFPWSLSEAAAHSLVPGVSVASPVFEAGDAFLFDELLVHRTTHGEDLDQRYAIESWFVAPSTYPAKHVPLVL